MLLYGGFIHTLGGIMIKKLTLILVFVSVLANMLACGSFAPPQSCGEGIGGTADEALFAEYFSDMQLVIEGTDEVPPPGSESGALVSTGDSLTVKMQVLKTATVRACVQERAGGGGIPADETRTVQPGEAYLPLGEFEKGSYVARIIVDGTLVKNLTFEVK